MAIKNGERRKRYGLVADRIRAAKHELIAALGIARGNGLRWTAQLEGRIGSLEALEAKFTKASQP